MSELAFNLNGEPFDVPAEAVGWRVRKMKHKGAPEVVYGRNGMPLVLPIEADLDDVRIETGSPGRYRLDPIDDERKPIQGAPAGYVVIHEAPSVEPANGNANLTTIAPLPPASDSVVIEAMRMNAEIARSVVCTFPQMLESAATLLRAADGAGLPARESRALAARDHEMVAEEDDDGADDDEDTASVPAGFDLNAIVAQLMPMLVTAFMSGKIKIPGLGELFDWRKASANASQPKAKATSTRETEPARREAKRTYIHETEPARPAAAARIDAEHDAEQMTDVEPTIPPLDAATMAHFIAIQAALEPDEAALARSVAADLGPAELHAWFADLKNLAIPNAVAKIRALIGKTGGAS